MDIATKMQGPAYLALWLWITLGFLLRTISGETLGMDGNPRRQGSGLVSPSKPINQGDGWIRIGVIAASQKGMNGDRPLQYAYRDGDRLGKMISTVGQVDANNLFLIKVESKAAFHKELEKIGKRIGELKHQNRKVFLQFYFSGHGGANNFHFPDGKVTFDEVKETLGGDRAEARVYVLDVCFGASFFTAKGFRTAPPVQLQMEMDHGAKGEVTISSSSVDEQAYEVKTLGGSIFTSQWIMALRGAGDSNRDGQVTLFEAYNYAYDRTAGYSSETLDRPQHPAYQMDLTGARDVMLARLQPSSTGILFQHCPQGLYNLIDLQRGSLIGELRIPEGDDFTLALEPGRYRVQYRQGKGPSLAVDVDLPNTGMATLPFTAFKTYVPPAAGMDNPKGAPEGTREGEDAPAQPGVLAQIGYSAWTGIGVFTDPNLEAGLNQRHEMHRYFGFGGGFRMPWARSLSGLDVHFPLAKNWTMGLQLGFSRMHSNWKESSTEPLHSVPDSLRGKYPIFLNWSYSFFDSHFGGSLARNIKVTQKQSLRLDGTVYFLYRQIASSQSVERPLFVSKTSSQEHFTGSGYRLEAGATWMRVLGFGEDRSNSGKRAWLVGIRVAPYLTKVDDDTRSDEPLTLDSRELGISATLSMTLQGRRATERK